MDVAGEHHVDDAAGRRDGVVRCGGVDGVSGNVDHVVGEIEHGRIQPLVAWRRRGCRRGGKGVSHGSGGRVAR